MKKLVITIVAGLLLLLLPVSAFAAEGPVIQVKIDGQAIEYEVHPVSKKNRTYVQFRPTFEELGMTVQWDAAARKVTAEKAGYKIELFVGKTEAYVNGVSFTLEAAPFASANYVMVPLRFISEATGRFVSWNQSEKLINIVTTDLSQFVDAFNGGKFTYVGEQKDGLWEGKGRLVYPNGMTFYEGDFAKGKLEGQGKYFDDKGFVVYEGGWKNNLMDGSGKWYYGDGTLKYEGEYKAGKREGKGTFIWREEDAEAVSNPLAEDEAKTGDNTYTGSFANDKFSGQGTIVWADGSTYTGSFLDGMIHGTGEYVWPDKWKYAGEFAFGARSGSGVVYDENGQEVYRGQFKNNEYAQ